jgi:hypothetical protein
MKKSVVILLLIFSGITIAQERKSAKINRTNTAPKIDGVLGDEAWKDANELKDFTQFRPEMGVKELAHQKSVIKMVYDDNAIYVSAYLHDKPEAIMRQFTSRDNFGQADFFGVVLNPNNDQQNDTEFFVFASGTQADAIATPSSGEDFGWNSVWDSAVKIVDDGWIVEMKIPYSTLRFSNREVQTWGVQFHRRFRTDNSQYSWNPIDRTKGNIGLYHGEITGIENIQPPTRLSFYPFASGLVKTFDGETTEDFSLGLDVKYGITENFTLDVTLIPDFSQVGFDDVRLNLGPFEQTFSEQRQFFTEGVDLFNKGNLFYSRRIGSAPSTYPNVESEKAEVVDYPTRVNMLNAIKVSGRTKKGLGIGFFNAITERTYAKIKDTSEMIRKELVEPLANYNIFVLDQQFNKNSSISFVNTNVLRDGYFRDANVSAIVADITSKSNVWNVNGGVKISSLNLLESEQTGFSGSIEIQKISGNYRYGIENNIADTKYDINDLGISFRNNYNNFEAYGSYRIFEPTETLNNFSVYAWAEYQMLYEPSTYTGNSLGFNVYAQNKKLWEFGGNINTQLGKQHDYFEPRTKGRFFTFKNPFNVNTWFNTNYAKLFAIRANAGFITLFDSERDVFEYWFGIDPRIRFNDKFSINYSFNYQNGSGSRGFVGNRNDDILFGQRAQTTIVNSLSGSYNFNSFHALSLSFRNYWATVTYDNGLFALLEDGTLTTEDDYTLTDISDPNVNFNTWNLDFGYSWQFAPGSQLTALYRNSLFNYNTASSDSYFESIDSLFKESIEHVFSLRLVYYIDYNSISNMLRKKA